VSFLSSRDATSPTVLLQQMCYARASRRGQAISNQERSPGSLGYPRGNTDTIVGRGRKDALVDVGIHGDG
jgi:hypothetical protein